MDKLVKAQLEVSERRTALAGLLDAETPDLEAIETAKHAVTDAEKRMQAVMVAEGGNEPVERTTGQPADAEARELVELRERVSLGPYVAAAMAGAPIMAGPELEYNEHLGLPANYFPLELLAGGLEMRAARDGDGEGNQATWLDRVIRDTAAARLGVTFPSVPHGVAAFPVMTAGGSGAQRGRTQDTAESTFTVAVTELKPTRHSVSGIYSIEDELRLPGLAAAIERDMAASIMESIDLAIFNGDNTANENIADITGFRTAGVVESTITQANKIQGDELLKLFLAYVDGVYATTMADVRMVASVGSNALWGGTVHAAAVDNQTVAAFLRANGVNWTVRGGIDTNTANGDFGAYFGLARGVDGAAVAPVWNRGQFIRDVYGDRATKGEVGLTLNYFWAFGIPRTDNFKRLKFVT